MEFTVYKPERDFSYKAPAISSYLFFKKNNNRVELIEQKQQIE